MRIKAVCFVAAASFAYANLALAQERIHVDRACDYSGALVGGEVWTFKASADARKAVARILKHTGLAQNFELQAADVENASAVIQNRKRLILYNTTFMERVARRTATDWAATSILAHEIGHHLNGHTLDKGGSRPELELQADMYSGHVLFKMGATLSQAQAAMNAVASEGGTSTHPPKRARLAAIAQGWTEAREQSSGASTRTTNRSPERPPERTSSPPPPKPNPPNPAPQLVCTFSDGNFQVLPDNTIIGQFGFITMHVANRVPSRDQRFIWMYEKLPVDPFADMAGKMLGMDTRERYGVDAQGQVWAENLFNPNALVKVGQCR